MRLALVRRSFSAVGGAELYLQRLLAGLRRAGNEVHLYAESWAGLAGDTILHPVRVGGSRAQRPWNFARAVEEQVRTANYDCVFSLERTLRQDVYRAGDGVHRVWLQRRRQFAPWWRGWWTGGFHRSMMALERETLNPANTRFVIVNSEMVRAEIREHFGFPEERMVLVRNGVEVARFRMGNRADTRRKFGFGENDCVCLFAGSGWERKGLRFVVDAVRQLSGRVKLIVAGKGRPFSAGPNVIFVGAVEQMEDLYAAADLFTFVPIYEPSANVCVEALAAGLPVITSRYNGAAELITRPELGAVLDNPSDVSALVREIERRSAKRDRVQVPEELLGLERNVEETLAVLERAAAAR